MPVPERWRRRSGAGRRVHPHRAGPDADVGTVAGTGAAWFGLCLLLIMFVGFFFCSVRLAGVSFEFGGKICPCQRPMTLALTFPFVRLTISERTMYYIRGE